MGSRRRTRAYRFVARVIASALPDVDKALRVRCTLNAADHSIVGVCAVAIHVGTDRTCDRVIELVHEPAGDDAPQPKYFEIVASLSPTAAPATRLNGALARGHACDGTEYRISGIMDPRRTDVHLPDLVLHGA